MNCCFDKILNFCVEQDCSFYYLKSNLSTLALETNYILNLFFLGSELKIKAICIDDEGTLRINKDDVNNSFSYLGQVYTENNELILNNSYDAFSFTTTPLIKKYV